MEDKSIIVIVALVCLTAIQVTAWFLGFNGQVTVFVSSTITAIIGYVIGAKKTTTAKT